MSKHKLIVMTVLLFLVPIAWPDDTVINIILKPRDWEDPTKADGYLFGIDSGLDSQRLIAELNSNFIFQQIDKTHDITPSYRTTVFDLVIFDKNNQPHRMLDHLPCSFEKDEPGLFTLFLAPGTRQCNQQTFEDAAEEKEGYYPLEVLVSSNFTEATERFISEAQSFKTFFNGKHPKLCASGMLMRNETAHSRRNELTSIFNFAFMEGRNFEAFLWKSCQTADETLNSIAKSNLFDLNADLSFKYHTQSIKEADGFAKIVILRKSSLNHKALVFATTDFPANGGPCTQASENDIVPLSSLVVFNYGDAESEVIVRVKQDDEIEEAECFVVNIRNVTEMQKHKRTKRGLGKKANTNMSGKTTVLTIQGDVKNCYIGTTAFTHCLASNFCNDEAGRARNERYEPEMERLIFGQDNYLTTNQKNLRKSKNLIGYSLIGYRGVSKKHHTPCKGYSIPSKPPPSAEGAHLFAEFVTGDPAYPLDGQWPLVGQYVSTSWRKATEYAMDSAYNLAEVEESGREEFERNGKWKSYGLVFRVYVPNDWIRGTKTISTDKNENPEDEQLEDLQHFANAVKKEFVVIQSPHGGTPDGGIERYQMYIRSTREETVYDINKIVLIDATSDFVYQF